MRVPSLALPALGGLLLVAGGTYGADYLTPAGRLTEQLQVTQLQGGFAGFTGVRWTVAPDGSWTSATLFNERVTPKDKGKLSPKEVAKLAALLARYDLAKLPAKSGVRPGANPHLLTFEYGKKKAVLEGAVPPKKDPEKAKGTVDGRFAGIWEGVRALLSPPPDKDAKPDRE